MKTILRSHSKITLIVAVFALAWFALSPTAQATLPGPPPDGIYPNGNTAEGEEALFNLTTGARNTALGDDALSKNKTGNDNTATGAAALENNTGNRNTANGSGALSSNTTGIDNTANGFKALFSNTTGGDNTANGFVALFNNTNGFANTANGFLALFNNTTGSGNAANGNDALFSNTTGNFNTANGVLALLSNTTGSDNTASGDSALESNTTGNNNVALGTNAGLNLTTGSNNIDIFDPGVAGESNSIRIGTQGTQTATYIAGIFGATASTPVGVDSNGHLGVLTVSSARFKKDIKPMDKTSEAILALKPVTFRYKKELDPKNTPQFGLVAEEVEKVNPALITRDGDGKPYTVRYEAVNAMLLNEFLKAHRRIEEQDKRIDELTTQLKQQAALIQKVNDKVELSKPAPRTVDNNQ